MAEVLLRPAVEVELVELSALALRSKGYWGYDADLLEACRQELTITPDRLAREVITVATDGLGGATLGYSALALDQPTAGLADLFVEPVAIGSGVGALLLARAQSDARAAGACSLRIEADPYAAAWYRRRGARDIGTVPSGSIAGRVLPLLEIDLGETDRTE
ncbi:MAG: GNAT family N-acetyltransferase [Acidimicrobiia bacterium]|nr:GNAT family N-acetyltransferase [Acidimicrobiia bacterium]MDH5292033.1 GNAT family N-acetyltransferase [Acidimicrobiia bacterium]